MCNRHPGQDNTSITPESPILSLLQSVPSPQATPDLLAATLSLFRSRISHRWHYMVWVIFLEVHRAVVGFSGLFVALVAWWSVVCTLVSVYPSLLRGDLGHLRLPFCRRGGILFFFF